MQQVTTSIDKYPHLTIKHDLATNSTFRQCALVHKDSETQQPSMRCTLGFTHISAHSDGI